MSHSTPARSNDVEYVTTWPAVLVFVATLAIFVGVGITGLLVNTRWRIAADRQANAALEVLTETQTVAQSKAREQSSAPPTAEDQAAAEQSIADIVENSHTMEAAASTLPPPPVAVPNQAISNDLQTNLRSDAAILKAAASPPPPVTIEEKTDDPLPKYEFQFLISLTENSVELDLDARPGTSLEFLSSTAATEGSKSGISTDSIPAASVRQRLLAQRSDLSGLPFRSELQCRMNPEDVEVMARISTLIDRAALRTNRLARGEATSELLMAREADFKVHRGFLWVG